MVGGVVIEVCQVPGHPDELYVNCIETLQSRQAAQCAVHVPRTTVSERIEIGDSLWWQSGHVMWTPAGVNQNIAGVVCGVDYDVRIPKLGYTNSKDPVWRHAVSRQALANRRK